MTNPKAILASVGITFGGLWLFIFLLPFFLFVDDTQETAEQCQERILNKMSEIYPELLKIIDGETSNFPQEVQEELEKECAEKFEEQANSLNNVADGIVEWFFVSFIIALFIYVLFILVIIGIKYWAENSNYNIRFR